MDDEIRSLDEVWAMPSAPLPEADLAPHMNRLHRAAEEALEAYDRYLESIR